MDWENVVLSALNNNAFNIEFTNLVNVAIMNNHIIYYRMLNTSDCCEKSIVIKNEYFTTRDVQTIVKCIFEEIAARLLKSYFDCDFVEYPRYYIDWLRS